MYILSTFYYYYSRLLSSARTRKSASIFSTVRMSELSPKTSARRVAGGGELREGGGRWRWQARRTEDGGRRTQKEGVGLRIQKEGGGRWSQAVDSSRLEAVENKRLFAKPAG